LVKVIPEKSKKFVPSDPSVLKDIIKKKKKRLDLLESEIDRMKQLYEIKEKEPVLIATGKRNFYKLMRLLPKPKKFEFNVKFSAEFNPEWVREKKAALSKGVVFKELVRVDEETLPNIKKWLRISKNMRKIKNSGVAVSLIDNSALMISLIKSNTLILIKDKPFIELMKELLNSYYTHAEKIVL